MSELILIRTHKYTDINSNSYIELLMDDNSNYYVRVFSNGSSYTTKPTGKYSAEYMFERHIQVVNKNYKRIAV